MIPTNFAIKDGTCLSTGLIGLLSKGLVSEPALSLCLEHIFHCQTCESQLAGYLAKPDPHGLPELPPVSSNIPDPLFASSILSSSTLKTQQSEIRAKGIIGKGKLIGNRFSVGQLLQSKPCTFVYLGTDLQTNEEVHITFLRPEFANLTDFRAIFLNRVRLIAGIRNPYILPILYFDDSPIAVVFVTPNPGKSTLARRLEQSSLSLQEIELLADSLLKGLKALHEMGLVHGPLLPSGIFIQLSNRGLDGAILGDAVLGPAFLQETSLKDAIAYQSPEQAMGMEPDFRSDFFSLGCVLFELHTGAKPWPNYREDITQKVPLDTPGLPSQCRELLRCLLELDPADRPSCHESIERMLSS